jgi:low temperature requirement protein LtrA
MMTLLLLNFCAGFVVAMLLSLAVFLYWKAGTWFADRFDEVGAPYWACVAVTYLAPISLSLCVYLLGDFAVGILLSGGLH